MEILSPTILLKIVDFPTFGLPTMAITGFTIMIAILSIPYIERTSCYSFIVKAKKLN
jgi:hypothetical protein